MTKADISEATARNLTAAINRLCEASPRQIMGVPIKPAKRQPKDRTAAERQRRYRRRKKLARAALVWAGAPIGP